jgi:hypothetical protein
MRMADLTNPILSVCTTVGSKLSGLPVKDAQLTFVRDKRKVVLDFDGVRTTYEQIQELATDGARTSMLAPVTGLYYFVLETSVLWIYQDGWVQITTPPDTVATKFTTDDTLTLGDDGVLKVNTTNVAAADNTLPITSAGVYTQIGNIAVLLETI